MITTVASKVMWVGRATVFLVGLAVILALVLALIGPEREAHATHLDPEIEVTTTADELNSDGDCSLREAIESANLGGAVDACTAPDPEDNRSRVTLPDGTYVLDNPDSGFLVVTERVYLQGEGPGNTIIDGANGACLHVKNASGSLFSTTVRELTIRNCGGSSAIDVDQGARLTLLESVVTENSAFTGGGIFNSGSTTVSDSTISANDGGARGGGIANSPAGDLMVYGSTIMDNAATAGGGGINNSGQLVVTNSTITGNEGRLRGGGIINTGTALINNSTITNNAANTRQDSSSVTYNGGGIKNYSPGAVALSNTILAGNTDFFSGTTATHLAGPDCSGTLTSNRNNIIGNNLGCVVDDPNSDGTPFDQVGTPSNPIDPLLEPLAANIGRTWTHALRPGSPAIDRGSSLTPGSGSFACEPIDQRFAPRPADGNGDGTAVCDIGAFELQPPPQMSISNARVTEGNSGTKNINFTVSLSAPSVQTVSVFFATANGTASTPSDYTAVSGTKTFTPGQLADQTISVAVKGDTRREPNETFRVSLSSPTNTTIADGVGVGTIVNND
jgi:CSLREA domain-containing protein